MCYNVKVTVKQLEAYAKSNDLRLDPDQLPIDYHYVNGFSHPRLAVITNEEPQMIQFYQWGLIPFWTKSEKDAKQISNKTLNAVGATIFEKPSFRAAAKERRCLVIIDGFFEYHHHNTGQKVPYYIYRKDQKPTILAGIWESWRNPETASLKRTFSIVTTRGNETLTAIHNNPDVLKRIGPRMPLMLSQESAEAWIDTSQDPQLIKELIQPYPDEDLQFHTVGTLQGKAGIGNQPQAIEEFNWQLSALP